MALVDSLKFWKKKEDETGTPVWNTLGNNPPMETPPPEMPGFGQDQFPPQPSFAPVSEPPLAYPQQPPQMAQPATLSSKDVELLSAKLDTIRAQLESLNTRIAHLERIAEGSQKGW